VPAGLVFGDGEIDSGKASAEVYRAITDRRVNGI
jgi:hypothetical protein